MSKDANPGELRTPVIVLEAIETRNDNGYLVKEWNNAFGAAYIKVKWVNLHGTEAWQQMSHELKEPATLTCRYSPKITELSRILQISDHERYENLISEGKELEAEELCYEVLSLDNVEQKNEWLEIRVQRWTRAK